MRLKDLWATLARRWYLLIVALAITAASTFYMVDYVGPTYEAEGSVLVFPPVETVARASEDQAIQGNPYLVLNGVSQARDIAIRSITSKSARDALAEQVPGSTFEATPDFTNSAPIILIKAEADSGPEAIAALRAVMERVPTVLSDLQSGLELKPSALITSRPLVADRIPTIVRKGQIRAGIVAGVASFGILLLLIGLVDGLLMRRRLRRKSKMVANQSEGEDADPEAPTDSTDSRDVREPQRHSRRGRKAATDPEPPHRERTDPESSPIVNEEAARDAVPSHQRSVRRGKESRALKVAQG